MLFLPYLQVLDRIYLHHSRTLVIWFLLVVVSNCNRLLILRSSYFIDCYYSKIWDLRLLNNNKPWSQPLGSGKTFIFVSKISSKIIKELLHRLMLAWRRELLFLQADRFQIWLTINRLLLCKSSTFLFKELLILVSVITMFLMRCSKKLLLKLSNAMRSEKEMGTKRKVLDQEWMQMTAILHFSASLQA